MQYFHINDFYEFITPKSNRRILLKDFIQNEFSEYKKHQNVKPDNLIRYLGSLNIILTYPVSEKLINEITESDIVTFLNELGKNRKSSSRTKNHYRSKLNHIFNYAIKLKLIHNNPVKYVQKLKEFPRNRLLTHHEIVLLLEECKKCSNPELYPIVMVALHTGMRYSNVVNMKKSNIHKNFYYLSGSETKSGKNQTVILNSTLRAILNDFTQKYDNGDAIFQCRYIKRSFNTALKNANICNFRFHDLRRTFATSLLNTGTDLKVIQDSLGHSSIKMTEIYLGSNTQKNIDAMEGLCFT